MWEGMRNKARKKHQQQQQQYELNKNTYHCEIKIDFYFEHLLNNSIGNSVFRQHPGI